MQAVRDWLLAVVRLPAGTPTPGLPAACTVESVLALAQQQGVAGLVDVRLRAVQDAGAHESALVDAFAAASRQLAAHSLWMRAETMRLVQALEAAGLRVLVLKGMALAHWLYPAPHLRASGDLDLLFATREDAEQAADLLVGLGYPDGYAQGGLAFEMLRKPAPGATYAMEIDIHWRLLNAPVFADKLPFDELWAQSQPLPALSGARGLGPAHALLHAAMNRVVNLYTGTGEVLKCLYDVHLLVAALDEAGWEQVLRLAADTGLCGVLHSALDASQRLLATEVPESVLATLLRQSSHETLDRQRLGDWAYMQRRSLAALPWRQRLPWLWGRLVPDTGYLRSKHGENASLPTLLAARCGRLLRRLLRLPSPSGRGA